MSERPLRAPRQPAHLALALILGAFAALLAGCASTRPGEPRLAAAVHGDAGPYLRAIVSEDGRRGSYETAVRRFRPANGGGPTIYLVGETHYADRPYFEERNRLLDGLDLVLYEDVRTGSGEGVDRQSKPPAERTRRQLELLAAMLRFELDDAGRLPASLDELADHPDARMAAQLREMLLRDAWGRPLRYEPERAADGAAAGFTLRSFGADGLPEGDGESADMAITHAQADTTDLEYATAAFILQACRVPGLLSNQFVRDDHPPNWRRADETFGEVRRRMDVAGASEQFTRLVRPSPRLAQLVAEHGAGPFTLELARLDDLNAVSHLFRRDLRTPDDNAADTVLLGFRNDIVFEELRRAMEQDPPPRTIGINYGAGHMPDLERRLGELGYEHDAELWVCAIRFDADRPGLTEKQSRMLRRTARAWSSKWASRAELPPRPRAAAPP